MYWILSHKGRSADIRQLQGKLVAIARSRTGSPVGSEIFDAEQIDDARRWCERQLAQRLANPAKTRRNRKVSARKTAEK